MTILKKIQNLLHWEPTPSPEVSLSDELYIQLKPFQLPLILLVMTMFIGTIGYIIIDDFSLMDAIFQTGITFTTVGFGEIAPISNAGRMFTITLIIMGFAVFSMAVGILVSQVNSGELTRLIKERRMLYQIARLKNHYVICYHNEYTIEVGKSLREHHIPFVVIDPSTDIDVIAKEQKYPYFIQGEPHTELSMLKAHLSSAKGVITLSNSIADNIAMIASIRLFQKEHFVPRDYFLISNAENKSDEEKLLKLGADSIVTPAKLTAERVTAMAARPDLENFMEEFLLNIDNPIRMEEVFVPKYSWLVLKKLKETHLREMANVSIIGVRNKVGNFTPMPKGDMLITSDSKLLLVGTNAGVSYTKKLIEKREKPEELRFA
ncbi:MAG: NAD-binding protein [Thiovulaceae bacterium]|nr:NAD-binding protein [Sulfurimonadaceae bacterium]